MLRRILQLFLVLLLLGGLLGAVALAWGYNYISRDLPRLNSISDYRPPMVSRIYAADEALIAEVYEERRYLVPLAEIPLPVRYAFLAAEDSGFYNHPGIDLLSILRAFIRNLQTGTVRQGGSTITQQVVKNMVLSSERKLERKIKEAILAYRIEQKLSKDDILEIYLNQIFFGSTAYGIKAAAQVYFRKTPAELSVAEAALLAGLPKAPSRYSPINNFRAAKQRQRYVLGQMVKANFITAVVAEEAYAEELTVQPVIRDTVFAAPYYVAETLRQLRERWKDLDVLRDGLKVYTAVDLAATTAAQQALRRGLREVDKRRGWRGPREHLGSVEESEFLERFGVDLPEQLQMGEVYPALVTAVKGFKAAVALRQGRGEVDLQEAAWARRLLDPRERVSWIQPQRLLKAGDVIEVSLAPGVAAAPIPVNGAEPVALPKLVLDQTPLLEAALILTDPSTGRVPVIVGGYDYGRSEFNRATQALRQPGSAFKPVVYLAAIDRAEYLPSTIVYDEPKSFKVGNEIWTPSNYDRSFLGPITLQLGLEKSRNLVSADITMRIGVDLVIQYARQLGIRSDLGSNPSLSLGSSEVTLLELTRAYGVFAAKGVLFDSVVVERIVDRDGRMLYDYRNDQLKTARRAVKEDSAFVLAHMMKGVIDRGTATRVKALKRPAAGKTGTSNDLMDAWFIGFTPEWSCGVWVGFDVKHSIGARQTGGVAAAPIWLHFMADFLDQQDQINQQKLVKELAAEAERLGLELPLPDTIAPLDFSVPEGVDPYWFDLNSGSATEAGTPGAVLGYFRRGTEPGRSSGSERVIEYWSDPDL